MWPPQRFAFRCDISKSVWPRVLKFCEWLCMGEGKKSIFGDFDLQLLSKLQPQEG